MAVDPTQEVAFDDPSQGYQELEPGNYVLKVKALLPCDPGQYGPMVEWLFNVADAGSSTPRYGQSGQPFELRQRTGTAMTPRAKARKWAEAFLGRDLTAEDNGAAIARELIGRKAAGLVGPNERGYSSILQIYPLQEGKGASKAAKSPAVQTLEDDLPAATSSENF